jgi:hypothetical protein
LIFGGTFFGETLDQTPILCEFLKGSDGASTGRVTLHIFTAACEDRAKNDTESDLLVRARQLRPNAKSHTDRLLECLDGVRLNENPIGAGKSIACDAACDALWGGKHHPHGYSAAAFGLSSR